jgi:hypothetical protein
MANQTGHCKLDFGYPGLREGGGGGIIHPDG